ncbi:hypothetical protein [Marinitoga sp. 1155]|uniref:hypothetical protein n=2 Tax=unclassified Marinitoga TaxID=2640159 RepID=UPI0006415E25|nr:hypothetical protein [Marinitoga sp. 1155]KLO21525.1 hypothetical protein X274_10275 [Marinitoga sp. 1155]
MFRSSRNVFVLDNLNDKLFSITSDAFNSLNMDKLFNFLISFYSHKPNKNSPYDPTSLLRLFFLLNSVFSEDGFTSSRDILSVVPPEYLQLCGFRDSVPCYTTYFYFKRRIGLSNLLSLLNSFKLALVKAYFNRFSFVFKKLGFIVLSVDSQPILVEGNVPKGIIHSHNKFYNNKFGIRFHHVDIVFPFYFNLFSVFRPANYHDISVFQDLIFDNIKSFIRFCSSKGIYVFFVLDKGYDSISNFHNIISAGAIPFIPLKKFSSFSKLSHIKIKDYRLFCSLSNHFLHSDGNDYSRNRHRFICPFRKNCNLNSYCSGRFWVPIIPNIQYYQSFKFNILRSKIPSSPIFNFIYRFRKRIENINAINSNKFSFRNTHYFRNFNHLLKFEIKLSSFLFKLFWFDSNVSIHSFLCSSYFPKPFIYIFKSAKFIKIKASKFFSSF